jgi:hypothetical protein
VDSRAILAFLFLDPLEVVRKPVSSPVRSFTAWATARCVARPRSRIPFAASRFLAQKTLPSDQERLSATRKNRELVLVLGQRRIRLYSIFSSVDIPSSARRSEVMVTMPSCESKFAD